MRGLPIPAALLLLIGVSPLAGQMDQSGAAKQPPAGRMVWALSNCPVELAAEQSHDGALSLAGRPAHAEQVIDLSITNSRLPRIVGAELAVHGTSPAGRVVALESARRGGRVADTVRNVHLEESVPGNQERMHRLAVQQLTSVAWIDVIELRYADGSIWRAGKDQECRVEPNPVLRVASEHHPR